MNRVSKFLSVVLIFSLALLGCEDKKDQQPANKLDLQGFQIIRTEKNGQETVIKVADFASQSEIQLLDKIGSTAYPPNTTLITLARCWDTVEQSKDDVEDYETRTPYTGPVSVFSILPDKVLFNPEDIMTSKMSCAISLSAEDSSGNNYILKNNIAGRLTDAEGKAYTNLTLRGSNHTVARPGLPVVNTDQIGDFLLKVYETESVVGYKLICETFELEGKSRSEEIGVDFKWISFDDAEFKNQDTLEIEKQKKIKDQTCRMLTYNNSGTVNGVSPYFTFRRDDIRRYDYPKNLTIIRNPGLSNEEELSQQEAMVSNYFDVSDSIKSDAYSENLILIANMSCKIRGIEESVKSSKKVPLSGPIPLYKLLPDEALFQKDDIGSESLSCSFQLLINEKEVDNPAPFSSILEGNIYDALGNPAIQLRDNGNPIPVTSTRLVEELANINRSELSRYSIHTADENTFDAYRLSCETFTLDEQVSEAKLIDMKLMDFTKARYQTAANADLEMVKGTPSQLCRVIVFKDQIVAGYSQYFNLVVPFSMPTVEIDLSQASPTLGSGGTSLGYHVTYNPSVKLGDLVITNNNITPVYVSVYYNEPSTYIQWFMQPGELATNVVPSGIRYWVYQRMQNDSSPMVQGAISETSPATTIYKVRSREQLRLGYYMQNFAYCGDYGGITIGMLYEITNPEVVFHFSNDVKKPDDAFGKSSRAQKIPINSETKRRFIFNTDLMKTKYSGANPDFTGNIERDNCGNGKHIIDYR